VGWNAVPAAGGGYATSGLGWRRGTRKQVYAVCAKANCYAAGTMTGRKELADGERYPFPGREWISRQKRGPAS